MPISMSLDAHYVTQTSTYHRITLGPLTNHRIAKYQKLGYYGKSGILFQSKEKTRKTSKAGRKASLAKLLEDFLP